uniref:EGF-like domain-containing protein n=1 Tax=Elaeophora elaphi TaxID=1147741 RepID=A0A0R3RGL5_9BILA
MHEAKRCRQLKWTFAGLSFVDSNIFINYTVHHENTSIALECAAKFVRQIIKEKLAVNVLQTICKNIQFSALSANYSTGCSEDKCAPGFYAAANGCYPCPLHSFSETVSARNCTRCPENTFTANAGSFSSQLCRKKCPPGFFSPTGLEPCQACAVGFYQSHYGSQYCNGCSSPLTTSMVGSVSASECVLKCKPGWFSRTGFQPCVKCPFGFYQDRAGQTTCNACIVDANKQMSVNNHCKGFSCKKSGCKNNGQCSNGRCICPFFYVGVDCSVATNLCLANFCSRGEECHFDGVTTSCLRHNNPSSEGIYLLKTCNRKLNSDSGLVAKQLSVWSQNLRVRKEEDEETVISIGSGVSLSDRPEPSMQFISGRLTSSEITATEKWISDTRHTARFLTTFSPSATKSGSCVTAINGNISCICREGYKTNGSDNCVLLQKCDYGPCGQDPCINVGDDYFCKCSVAHNAFHQQQWCPINKKCDQKNLCKNNGISVCNYKSPCICPTSYYGEFCAEKAKPCKNLPCHHSTCIPQFDHLWPYYFCKCDPGLINIFLLNIYPISPTINKVLVFADIILIKLDGFSIPGYYGEKCTAHAVCAGRNIGCVHGYCRKNNQAAYCECYPGFTGSDCSVEINQCDLSPCVHGTCKPKFLGYTCICDEGFKGNRCEKSIDPCDEKLCSIHSECRALSYGYKGKFVCNCAAGWTGKYCTELIDLCINAHCISGSTCITRPEVSGDIGYVCICPPNKAGTFCNESVDYCEPVNPCLHGGICQRKDDGYICHCKPGYRGDYCQHNLCSPNPCQNNGNCTTLSLTTYRCTCPQYYEGVNCTVVTNACAVSNFEDYCLNDGKCISNNSEPFCRCTYQYEGRRCENKKDLDFNVVFNEQTRNLTSPSFDASVLKEFTLCFWIRIMSMEKNSFVSFLDFVQQELGKNVLSITENAVRFGNYAEWTSITENQWQQFCFRRKEDGTTEWIRNGKVVWKRNWDIPVINGSLRISLGASKSFQGEMSMVQLYNRALCNKQINDSIHYCKQWLQSIVTSSETPIIEWNQFTGVKRGNRNFPGICTLSECLLNPHRCSSTIEVNFVAFHPFISEIFVTDKVPPKVINCPANIIITSKNRLTIVDWFPSKSSEIFADNGVINTSSNYNSGDLFTWGKYHIVYIAEDEAGNIETCQFDLVVAAMNCSNPEKTDGINFMVQNIYSENVRKVAFVGCKANYMPLHPITDLYFCDLMGQWARWPHGINFYFPSCLKYRAPLQQLSGLVVVTANCREFDMYKKNLTTVILNADKQFNRFCITPNCSNELKIWSNSSCKNRVLGESNQLIQNIHLYYSITVNQILSTTRKSIKPILTENLNKVFGNNTGKPNTSWQCPSKNYPAQIFGSDTHSCVKCPPGMYCVNNKCMPCPENTFKKYPGCKQCTLCPNNTITGPIIEDIGYQSIFDCYTNCSVGYHYSIQEGNCVKCPKGMYQDLPGQLRCNACPESRSTPKRVYPFCLLARLGSVHISNCTVTCGAGMSMNAQSQCVKCAKGKYRKENSTEVGCTPCPDYFTTSGYGSISQSNCTVLDCPPGTYINLLSPSECFFCPRNHYQGSVHPRQCMKPLFWNSVVSNVDIMQSLLIKFTNECLFSPLRIRWLFCKIRQTQLKRIATLNYYRDSSFAYPIVTLTPTNTGAAPDFTEDRVPKNVEPQEVVEIYQEIYDGLYSVAEGTSGMSNSELTPSQYLRPISRTRLEVDTSLRAEFSGDPKALGMDSSGFPIDSADYEIADQYKSMDAESYGQNLQTSDEDNQISSFKRRLDAYRNWNLRIPLDEIHAEPTEYKLFLSNVSDISAEKTSGILHEESEDRENKDEESDDEVCVIKTGE